MKIYLNEIPLEIEPEKSIAALVSAYKPSADVLILNGFPVNSDRVLKEGDRLVLIKRGEIPTIEELDVLMTARHTPGVHQKLKSASIGIAGCGGLGSNIAIALARVGVGCLVIVDFDVVEPSNLNRQQYFIDQIGMLKVDALKINLARINPAVKVQTQAIRLDATNIADVFKPTNVIVEAFDRADQKAMLVDTVESLFPDKPLVMGVGMAGYGGNNLLKSRSVGNLHVCGDEVSEAGFNFGLMAPRVGVVACMQANQVLEILLGSDPNM